MKKLILLSTFAALIMPSISTAKNTGPIYIKDIATNKSNIKAKDESETLRILNLEDYIYLQEEEEELPDLIDQFVEYANSLGYENCEVVYNTTDTNETMYNELLTGKAQYDILCTSDYMIQKMVNDKLLYKLDSQDKKAIPHYFGEESSVSNLIAARLGNIETNDGSKLEDYTVGYMWGTLGILFNPTYKEFQKRGIDADTIIYDMQSWSGLWDSKYKNTLSIKDSVRDLYAVGVMYTYNEELEVAKKKYIQDGDMSAYNATIDDIFNRCSPEQINEVKGNLIDLKRNSFGLEVDSGKQDIVTGKIGMNIAWSGDACYSIYEASIPQEGEEEGFELLYSIPENGSNVWFDGWIIPNTARSIKQQELALLWLDFVSDPAFAVQNMAYTGYTSFIGGEDIASYVYDEYDVRAEMSEEELAEFNPDDYEEVDLTYFFGDNLPSESEFFDEDGNVIFYSDNYLPYYYEKEGELVHNISVGSGFFCQYPDVEAIARCGVMRDFGAANANIVKMWEDFKSDALPTWAIILFSVELVLIVGGAALFFINKRASLHLRKKRHQK